MVFVGEHPLDWCSLQWRHPVQTFSSSSPRADLDDPLVDLLDELDLEETKSEPNKSPSKKAVPSPTGTPVLKTKEPGV